MLNDARLSLPFNWNMFSGKDLQLSQLGTCDPVLLVIFYYLKLFPEILVIPANFV